MKLHVATGKLLDFDGLGVGMVLEIKNSREPVLTETQKQRESHRPFLLKASYVLDVLIEDHVHTVSISVHWYHPGGAPQGWWCTNSRELSRSDWHSIKWL